MLSYIYMKFLEKYPQKYDSGIGSHSAEIRDEIISEHVKPGIKMLDVGCGTGMLVEKAAKIGAEVSGIDISEKMLEISKNRIERLNLQNKVSLHYSESGIAEMDVLFKDNSFDLITSTLLISELYNEELSWLLKEMRRVLNSSGTVVIAGEISPKGFLKRLSYLLLRLPLLVFTYSTTQSTTRPVKNLSSKIKNAGFTVLTERHSSLFGSFVIISAQKSKIFDGAEKGTLYNPASDISRLKTLWDYLGRWFPNPVTPGLRIIGNPDKNSPVIVTSNFHLTVRRVEKILTNESCFLLVAPTNGINVWCASCGGSMDTSSIIRVIKTSGITDLVNCHKIILPQLCAPGVDRKLLFDKTAWKSTFGPARAEDLPEFFSENNKTPKQSLFEFTLKFRFEMLLSMNVLLWILSCGVISLINPLLILPFSCVFWIIGLILYIGFPAIPGNSGILKALLLSVVGVLGIIITMFIQNEYWLTNWGWMIAVFLIAMWFGFDLRGIVGGYKSEAEHFLYKIGIKSFGRFFSVSAKSFGTIKLDSDKCISCLACVNVCPQGVFEYTNSKKIVLKRPDKCFACNACTKQCPKHALFI